jgi:hypothetical protein
VAFSVVAEFSISLRSAGQEPIPTARSPIPDSHVCYYKALTALVTQTAQTEHHERLWRTPLLALCGLVFFFALHAKIAVYNGGAPVKATPSTASKLWINGQKMQVRSGDSSPSALFVVTLLCLYGMFLQSVGVQSVLLTAPPNDLTLRYRRRFLRPPPVLA